MEKKKKVKILQTADAAGAGVADAAGAAANAGNAANAANAGNAGNAGSSMGTLPKNTVNWLQGELKPRELSLGTDVANTGTAGANTGMDVANTGTDGANTGTDVANTGTDVANTGTDVANTGTAGSDGADAVAGASDGFDYGKSAQERFREMLSADKKRNSEIEKRQRRNKVIAAIGDGISALSNLYYTHERGSDNLYDPRAGLLPKMQERYDRINKERKANQQAWREGMLKAEDMDFRRAMDKRKEERDIANDKYQRERDKKEDEYRRERDKKKDEQWQQSFYQKQDDIKEDNDIAWSRVRKMTNGSSGRSHPVLNIDGRDVVYSTMADYKRAVYALARDYGIDYEREEVVYPAKYFPNGTLMEAARTRTVRMPIDELAAAVEHENAQRYGASGNKKGNKDLRRKGTEAAKDRKKVSVI